MKCVPKRTETRGSKAQQNEMEKIRGLVSPLCFPVGLRWILPDSTGLHWTQCLVGHYTNFLDWTGFSVQWSPVESTRFSVQSDSTRLKIQ